MRPASLRAVSLTWRGWVVLIVAMLGFFAAYAVGADGIHFVSLTLVAAVGASLLAARHRRPSLAVHRSFGADRAMSAQPVPVTLDVANLSLRTVGAATWTDEWQWRSPAGALADGPHGTSPPAELPVLRGRWGDVHRSVPVAWDFVPPRRGEFDVGPLRVTVNDPFGLASATVTAGDATRLTVLPRVVPLGESTLALRRADGQAYRADHRATGGEHEVTTRAYRVGDPMRRVHWRASAHHGELMVRQEEQRSAAEASILLETRRARYHDVDEGDAHESELFEWAVSMTASLAEHLDQAGFRVHVLETGAPQLAPAPGPSLSGLARLGLTRLQSPTGVSLVPAGRQSGARLGSAFAVLGDLDEATASALAAARSAYDTATAFVATTTRYPAAAALSVAGWNCVRVTSGMDIAEAWALAEQGGPHRGFA